MTVLHKKTGRRVIYREIDMTREEYQDYGASEDALFLTEDFYDEAIIGVDYSGRIVYDVAKIIEVLQTADGMTEDEACEYFEYNIAGAYVGDMTPIFVYRTEEI